jgi:hypothetical protein
MKEVILERICRAADTIKQYSYSFARVQDESGWYSLRPSMLDLETWLRKHPEVLDTWRGFPRAPHTSGLWRMGFDEELNEWRIAGKDELHTVKDKFEAYAFFIYKFFDSFSDPRYFSSTYKICHLSKDHFEKNLSIENLIRIGKLKKKDIDYNLMLPFFQYNPNVVEPWKRFRGLNPGKKDWELQCKDKTEMESLVLYANFYLKNIFFEIGQYHKPKLNLVDSDIGKKNTKIKFEEIIFSSHDEFDRFVVSIEKSIAQGKVEELDRIGKNKFKAFVHPFIKGHRYFRIKGDQQVWILCSFEGPSKASFQKYHPNLRYD